jgi:DNA-binding NtrC family response regulator
LSDLQIGDSVAADSQQDSGLKSLARSDKNVAEAEAIARALQQTNWHRQKAAAILQISYKALLYKIRQYELQPPARTAGKPEPPPLSSAARAV